MPSESGHCARTEPHWWIFCAFYPLKCSSIAPAGMINAPRWLFPPLGDNQWGVCSLDPKKSRWEIFQRFIALVNRYADTPLIVTLSPGHSDITRFRPWSPIAPDRKSIGSSWKNSRSCSDDWHRWRFWSAFRHFGPTSRRVSACPNIHEWWTQPAHVRCPVAQLLI